MQCALLDAAHVAGIDLTLGPYRFAPKTCGSPTTTPAPVVPPAPLCGSHVSTAPSAVAAPEPNVASEADCQAACQTPEWCESYIYDPSSEDCTLLGDRDLASIDMHSGPYRYGPNVCPEGTAPGVLCSLGVDTPPSQIAPSLLAVPTEEECQASCQEYPWCVSYLYDPGTLDCLHGGDVENGPIDMTPGGFKYGPKFCPEQQSCFDIGRVDFTLAASVTDEDSAVNCQEACASMEDCVAFAYDSAEAVPCAVVSAAREAEFYASLHLGAGSMVIGPAVCPTTTEPPPEPVCDASAVHLEVAYVQDLSGSYRTRWDALHVGSVAAAAVMAQEYVSAKFALATYSDKPVYPLGYKQSFDYCWHLHSALGDKGSFDLQMGRTFTRSGGDWKEDVMDAIHQTAANERVRWSSSSVAEDGNAIRQVIVVNTDGGIHYGGDGVRHGLAPHDGGAALRCDTMDYPSVETVATALQRMGNGKPVVRFVVPPKRQMEYEELCLLLDGFGIDAQVVFSDSYTSEDQRVAVEAGMDVCVPPRRRSLGSRAVFERLLRSSPEDYGMQPPVSVPDGSFGWAEEP
eukprot:Polyplicarium_translucidae@DN3272_c0_g1_i11.p2